MLQSSSRSMERPFIGAEQSCRVFQLGPPQTCLCSRRRTVMRLELIPRSSMKGPYMEGRDKLCEYLQG